MPADERARYAAAWQGFYACRDCQHWQCKPQQTIGRCELETQAAFITPEDYTCDAWKDAKS